MIGRSLFQNRRKTICGNIPYNVVEFLERRIPEVVEKLFFHNKGFEAVLERETARAYLHAGDIIKICTQIILRT